MRNFHRIALLGVFAATGTGLAVFVGLSSPPSTIEGPVVVAVASDEGAESVRASSASPAPAMRAPTASSRQDSGPVLVMPGGPIAAEHAAPPRELLTQAGNSPAEDQVLEYLQRQLSAPAAPLPAGALGGNPPSAPDRLPPPAAGLPPGSTGGSAAPAEIQPRTVVKADPEGDGKLTIHIQNSDIREVLDLLSEQGGLNILAGRDVQGKVSASLTGVDIQSALDAILRSTGYVARRQGPYVFVGTPEDFNSMEQALDRVATRVYRPNYVTAAELKTLIQPLLTEKIGVVSVSSPAESGIATNNTSAGGDKYAGGDVVLVRDYEAALLQIDQMVAEIDVRPLQVAIEAMILSVKLDDSDNFGVNFELLRDHMRFGWGTPLSAMKDFAFKGGLKFGYLDSNVGAFVDALEQVAETNVVATPRLMVINKHRAEILIGQKKGYVSTTVTETASTQAIDFLEVGAQLRLRPFISRDGLVRMEVHPELSDGNVEVIEKMTLPNKSVTEVTTNIMVRDGCTVVIGGLIKDQKTNSTTAIPLLGGLPWVGAVFRNTKQTTERHEVIVLITPRIVYEPAACQEGEAEGCEFQRRQAVYAEKMNPLGKRHIARRYLRLARAAWNKGNQETALRFAEMAVHFDPLNREAIELRSQIWQGKQNGETTLVTAAHVGDGIAAPPQSGTGRASIDGPEITPWVLDDLRRETPSAMPPESLHPLDPGQPGSHREIPRPQRLE